MVWLFEEGEGGGGGGGGGGDEMRFLMRRGEWIVGRVEFCFVLFYLAVVVR